MFSLQLHLKPYKGRKDVQAGRLPQHPEGTTIGRGAAGREVADLLPLAEEAPFRAARCDGVDVLAVPRGLRFAAPVLVPLQGIAGGRAGWRLLLSDDVMLSCPYAGPLGELGDLLFAVDAGRA